MAGSKTSPAAPHHSPELALPSEPSPPTPPLPRPHALSVENLSFRKLVPGAKNAGDHCSKGMNLSLNIWQFLETFFIVTTQGGRVLLACSDKAQDTPSNKDNYLVQNVNGANNFGNSDLKQVHIAHRAMIS